MSASLCHNFTLPEDGWFHIAVPGEWPHKPTGLMQVIDDDAIDSIVSNFAENSQQPQWPGVLIDFDHQSLDQDKPSVAAGWITNLDKRPNGIWAQIRWSDLGQKSIEGGRYRFISPVWRSSDCAMLGDDRIRPLKLMNCAVTNDPNIKGMFPLSNSSTHVPMRFAPPALPILPPMIPLRMYGDILFRNAARVNPRTGKPYSDDQLRAIHASRGGGGGGGRPRVSSGGPGSSGWEAGQIAQGWAAMGVDTGYRPSAPTGTPVPTAHNPATPQPATPPPGAPAPSAVPAYVRDHESRVAALEDRRARIDSNRPTPPPERITYQLLNVNEVRQAALRSGAGPNEINRAVSEAQAINSQRQAALNAVMQDINSRYQSEAARDRAFARHMQQIDRDHDRAVSAYNRALDDRDNELASIDRALAEERIRWNESENRAAITQAQRDARAQVEADRAAERARQAAIREQARLQREQERQREQPVRDAAAERRRQTEYYNAIIRGDDYLASQLYPDADHAAVRSRYQAIASASSPRDVSAMRRNIQYMLTQPIPQRSP